MSATEIITSFINICGYNHIFVRLYLSHLQTYYQQNVEPQIQFIIIVILPQIDYSIKYNTK